MLLDTFLANFAIVAGEREDFFFFLMISLLALVALINLKND